MGGVGDEIGRCSRAQGGEDGAGVVVGEEVVRVTRMDGGVCRGVVDEREEGCEGGPERVSLFVLICFWLKF